MSLHGRGEEAIRNGKKLVGENAPSGGHHARDREEGSEGDEAEELRRQTLEGERVEQMREIAGEKGRVLRQQDGRQFSD